MHICRIAKYLQRATIPDKKNDLRALALFSCATRFWGDGNMLRHNSYFNDGAILGAGRRLCHTDQERTAIPATALRSWLPAAWNPDWRSCLRPRRQQHRQHYRHVGLHRGWSIRSLRQAFTHSEYVVVALTIRTPTKRSAPSGRAKNQPI